jgi:hypothetical protein
MNDSQAAMTVSELGRRLVERRRLLDAGEAEWLDWLAAFERRAGWAVDGHLCCASWLVDRCGMARATAKERLRVACELQRRPRIAALFRTGDLTYSKVRAMTRITGGDDELDEALIRLANVGTAADLELCVRHFKLLQDQERSTAPRARWEKRGLRIIHRLDGMGSTEIVQPIETQARMLAIIDAWINAHLDDPVDTAPAGAPSTDPQADPLGKPSWSQRRADALPDLLEAGFAHLMDHKPVDPEIATVSAIVDYQVLCENVAGTARIGTVPVTGEAARRLACDAGVCRIIVRGESEILDVGRKTRQWNRAQRRAIQFRHNNTCAFPGCNHTIVQIHHTNPWSNHGSTDLDAGIPLCWGHHDLVHEGGWTVNYHGPTSTITFTSPDGRQVQAAVKPRLDQLFAA